VVKVISLLLVISIISITTAAYAQEGSQPATDYVVNRGLFGVVYKGVVSVFKVFEAILFGKYGVKGLNDYFRADKVLYEQTPKY